MKKPNTKLAEHTEGHVVLSESYHFQQGLLKIATGIHSVIQSIILPCGLHN